MHFSPALCREPFKQRRWGGASDELLMHPGDQVAPMRALDLAARLPQRHVALPLPAQAGAFLIQEAVAAHAKVQKRTIASALIT